MTPYLLPNAVFSVALSSDGTQIVTGGSDQTVLVWDVATREEVARLIGNIGIVWSVAFSPDGRQVVSGGSDGTVRVWDVAAGEEVHG